jgi:hypothetical protein
MTWLVLALMSSPHLEPMWLSPSVSVLVLVLVLVLALALI